MNMFGYDNFVNASSETKHTNICTFAWLNSCIRYITVQSYHLYFAEYILWLKVLRTGWQNIHVWY